MKNIEQILKEAGLEVTDEQKAAINAAVTENYRTKADYDKQVKKTEAAEGERDTYKGQLADAQETIKGFDGVDVEKLNKDIADWKERAEKAEKDFADKIAERDFDDILKSEISAMKGKNEKAIRANLDIESLRKSRNQREDVKKALESLKGGEDTSFMFLDEEADAKKAAEEEARKKAAESAPKGRFTAKSEGKPAQGGDKPLFNFGFTPIREVKKGD